MRLPQFRATTVSVLMSLTLAACSVNGNAPRLTEPSLPPPPQLTAEILSCPTPKDPGVVKRWSTSDVEALLELERGKIDKLNGCLIRLICSTKEYRVKISQVEGETLCRGTK